MNFDVTVNGRPWRVGIEAADGSGPVQVSIKGAKRSFSASWIDANTLSLIALDGEGRVCEFGIRSQDAGRVEVTTAGRVFHAAVALDGQSKARYAHRKEHTAEVEGRQEIAGFSRPGAGNFTPGRGRRRMSEQAR